MHSKIPIIALTADVTTVDLAVCKDVGMNDYIAKPVDEKLLYSKIVGLVKRTTPVNGYKANGNGKSESVKSIDLTYLKKSTKSKPSLMMEMISLYLAQTPALIKVMKEGSKNEDWDSVKSAVHKMIPSFSIMGIGKDIENMARKVQEDAGTRQDTDEIPGLVSQIETACLLACQELEEEYEIIKNTIV